MSTGDGDELVRWAGSGFRVDPARDHQVLAKIARMAMAVRPRGGLEVWWVPHAMLGRMSYDYSPTGWYATFDRTKHPEGHVQAQIEAWSPDGDAMIIGLRGSLTPVVKIPGFKAIHRCSRIVAVIPAVEGWEVKIPAQDGEAGYREPVIGWVVDDDGEAQPITATSGDGNATAQPVRNQTLLWKGRVPESYEDNEDVAT